MDWYQAITNLTHQYAILSTEYSCRNVDLSAEEDRVTITESTTIKVSDLGDAERECYERESSIIDENEAVQVYDLTIVSSGEKVTLYIPDSWQ